MSAKRGGPPTLRDQLYRAAEVGDATKVRSLLSQGVPVGIKNTRWMTPLHLASQGGHTEAVQVRLQQCTLHGYAYDALNPMATM